MPFYNQEEIEKARQVDLFTYLQTCEPQELVHVSGNVYCTREHDSLRISNGKWCWFSRGIGGYSALDYLIKVKGCSFMEAMERPSSAGRPSRRRPVRPPQMRKSPSTCFCRRPPRITGPCSNILRAGALTGRFWTTALRPGGFMRAGTRATATWFLWVLTKPGKARFGCLRGIGEGRFHGDVSGSDKHYSFALPACVENPAVHLCECAIDVMSYATLCKLDGIDWRRHNLLSLAGIYQPKKKIEESKLPARPHPVFWRITPM